MERNDLRELGLEIIAGMHSEIRDRDLTYGRMEVMADCVLPTPEELATEGLTEIPDYCYRAVERNTARLYSQADFIAPVIVAKILSLGYDIVPRERR